MVFPVFLGIRTKYLSEFNKIDKHVNRMCFSKLYENSVHKKLSSKNVTGPCLCNVLYTSYATCGHRIFISAIQYDRFIQLYDIK